MKKHYNVGKNNARYLGSKDVSCLNCGKIFTVCITKNRKFCSRGCVSRYFSNDARERIFISKPWEYEHTEEHNKKVSIALKEKRNTSSN